VIPAVVGSSPIVHPTYTEIAADEVFRRRSRRKPRLSPAGTELMSAKIAGGGPAERSGQKPRLLPAVDEAMSAEIAAGNFSQ
jgi:hypothetical protein